VERNVRPTSNRTMLAAAVLLGGVALLLVVAALPTDAPSADISVIPKERYMDPAAAEPEVVKPEGPAQEDVVRAAVLAFYAALARRDVNALAALWIQTDDATLMRPEVVHVKGWAPVRDALSTLSGKVEATPKDLRVRVGTRTAEVAALESLRLLAEPDAAPMENISVTILKRDGDVWKVMGHRAVPREKSGVAAIPVPKPTTK